MIFKSAVFKILFELTFFTITVVSDDMQVNFVRTECEKYPSHPIRDWELEEKYVLIDFFFVSTSQWNGSEDVIVKIIFEYPKFNDTTQKLTKTLFLVPPVPYEQASIPFPPIPNTTIFPFLDLRIGWNRINLTYTNDSNESLSFRIDDITTGVDFKTQGPIVLTVIGVSIFINCDDFDGFRRYDLYPTPPTSNLLSFFWNDEKETLGWGGRQVINLGINPEDIHLTTYPGGTSLVLCQENNTNELNVFYLMKKCRTGWRGAVDTKTDPNLGVYGFIADLKEECFAVRNYCFINLNVTWTGKRGDFHKWLATVDHNPVDVFYDEVFPLGGDCPSHLTTLLQVDIVLGIVNIILIVIFVIYFLKLNQQIKINKNKDKEIKELSQKVGKLFGQWYVNAYPGEIKKLLDERKSRKEKLKKLSNSSAEPENLYDGQLVTLKRSNSRKNTPSLRSDLETEYEIPTELELSPIPEVAENTV